MQRLRDRESRWHAVTARTLPPVLGLTLSGAACIVVPIPSVTPDYQAGIIETSILESLVGLERDRVIERIGQPDVAGSDGDAYLLVYQGEKRYSTEVYAAVSAGYTGAVGKIDDGATSVLYCQVLVLDEHGVVEDYDVIARPTAGVARRGASDDALDPVTDCSEVLW